MNGFTPAAQKEMALCSQKNWRELLERASWLEEEDVVYSLANWLDLAGHPCADAVRDLPNAERAASGTESDGTVRDDSEEPCDTWEITLPTAVIQIRVCRPSSLIETATISAADWATLRCLADLMADQCTHQAAQTALHHGTEEAALEAIRFRPHHACRWIAHMHIINKARYAEMMRIIWSHPDLHALGDTILEIVDSDGAAQIQAGAVGGGGDEKQPVAKPRRKKRKAS